MRIDRTGEVHYTTEGDKFTIIKYVNNRDSTIQFEDGVIQYNRDYKSIRLGVIKHLNNRNIYSIGYIGYGEYTYTNSPKAYKTWHSMLQRCYETNTINNLSYKNRIKVCEEWECFQNFVPWFNKNYNFETMNKWELDKDILCPKCNLYSPETCLFLPREINSRMCKTIQKIGQLVGTRETKYFRFQSVALFGDSIRRKNYASAEDAHNSWLEVRKYTFTKLAEKYKDSLDYRGYQALMNITVDNLVIK